ncbi:hypothetical protein V8E52_010769 [Russula decolorans]
MTILRARQQQSMNVMGQERNLPIEVDVKCQSAYSQMISSQIYLIYIEAQSHPDQRIKTWDTLVYITIAWLDVWPFLPIVMRVNTPSTWDLDGPIAVLRPQCLPSSQLEFVSMVMQGPFSKLTNLLLSSFDLVELILCFIPLSEYLSPEVMVTSLSSLTGLEYFSLGFQFYQTRPDQNSRCPPPMRAVLPALRRFSFEGANEYLEDLVAWIDTPQLEVCSIDLHGQIIYDIPHLSEFISCSTVLKGFSQTTLTNTDVWRWAPQVGLLISDTDLHVIVAPLSAPSYGCAESLHI